MQNTLISLINTHQIGNLEMISPIDKIDVQKVRYIQSNKNLFNIKLWKTH
jgi:hypothetical protein